MGEKLPYDEGSAAYENRIPLGQNPYYVTDWQYEEWDKGWMAKNDMDPMDLYDWSADKFK